MLTKERTVLLSSETGRRFYLSFFLRDFFSFPEFALSFNDYTLAGLPGESAIIGFAAETMTVAVDFASFFSRDFTVPSKEYLLSGLISGSKLVEKYRP